MYCIQIVNKTFCKWHSTYLKYVKFRHAYKEENRSRRKSKIGALTMKSTRMRILQAALKQSLDKDPSGLLSSFWIYPFCTFTYHSVLYKLGIHILSESAALLSAANQEVSTTKLKVTIAYFPYKNMLFKSQFYTICTKTSSLNAWTQLVTHRPVL